MEDLLGERLHFPNMHHFRQEEWHVIHSYQHLGFSLKKKNWNMSMWEFEQTCIFIALLCNPPEQVIRILKGGLDETRIALNKESSCFDSTSLSKAFCWFILTLAHLWVIMLNLGLLSGGADQVLTFGVLGDCKFQWWWCRGQDSKSNPALISG